MKISEIARYWAAKELTRMTADGGTLRLHAPFSCPQFTLRVAVRSDAPPKLTAKEEPVTLRQASGTTDLKPGAWLRDEQGIVVCFDLPKGDSALTL
jgi:hypothetical protein